MKIHLLGPSGSGTSTLGKAIADALDCAWLDSDDFFWEKTDPPFISKRSVDERIALLRNVMSGVDSWVLSGSVLGWGDLLKQEFDLVIYKYIDRDTRLARLREREKRRYGSRINEGREMHKSHCEFLEWAAAYEEGGMDMRSRMSELAWIDDLKCRVLKMEKAIPLKDELAAVLRILNEMAR